MILLIDIGIYITTKKQIIQRILIFVYDGNYKIRQSTNKHWLLKHISIP